MALTKRWTDWALKLHTKTAQAGAAVHVAGIRSLGVDPSLRTALEAADGSPYATFGSLVAGAPGMTLSTSDLKTFLDQCGVAGMLVDADAGHPGVVGYFQKMAAGGTRDALGAGTHVSTTFSDGLLVPRRLSAAHGGTAVLEAALVGAKADGTVPYALNEADSLTAATYPAVSSVWTVGPVKLNATPLAGVQSVAVDFGLAVTAEAADGDLYPSVASILSIRPSISVTSRHVDITGTLTEAGVEYAASQVVVYLRKRDEGGAYVADGTAEHVKFTLGKCRVEWATAGDPKTLTAVITPWYTAGGSPVAPLAVNTASAIT